MDGRHHPHTKTALGGPTQPKDEPILFSGTCMCEHDCARSAIEAKEREET